MSATKSAAHSDSGTLSASNAFCTRCGYAASFLNTLQTSQWIINPHYRLHRLVNHSVNPLIHRMLLRFCGFNGLKAVLHSYSDTTICTVICTLTSSTHPPPYHMHIPFPYISASLPLRCIHGRGSRDEFSSKYDTLISSTSSWI